MSEKSLSGRVWSWKRERPERRTSPVSRLFQRDLGAVGQLADDVVECVGRNGGRTWFGHVGRDRFHDLDVEIVWP